ncbi:Uma2 family endonuclease [Streptomyces sp. NBC_00190]|uniref:Uma2 family endonuclease n=1 Tax=Streptomyces sp. NBC_00190 TaxID=2903634 RepID=UPI002E299D6A|nr:Uma2 family endonuclease [Streptomyces sp. NBC_00190]
MSALTVQHEPQGGDSWDELVRRWEAMDWPEGCKVEIIEGIITVAPPPVGKHSLIAAKLQRCLISAIPEDWDVHQTLGVAVPSRSGLYIPDLLVAPDAVVDGAPFIPAAAVELAVEVTSPSNASHDRIAKAAGYAQAGVPLYLLIDGHAPGGPTVTLYGEPSENVYRVLWAGKFGDTFRLPAPFGIEIDTSVFPTP